MHRLIELHLEGSYKRIVLNPTYNRHLFEDEVNNEIMRDIIKLKKNFRMCHDRESDKWDIVIE